MAAARLDLYVEQGVDFERLINFSTDGARTDLTGHTFFGQIRPEAGGILSGTLNAQVQDQVTAKGDVILRLTAAETWSLKTNPSPRGDRVDTYYRYDLIQKHPDGKLERVLEGRLTLSPGVTRVSV